ncbi:hypothetical protein DSM106972_035730 [Dulcicalothrix desertica PCC 7102]|uniref:Glycosyltransferase 61 catalytic domain-containing protein n=1 Tax=Dulcicalothrix desertica PCC 7102 TaxID=232991 RepID=A0A433VHN9_9CYAN|nr:glycosyltransferase family 61 protein [Dulcicalothrix desertica]RUT05566.1 hypothetical protein DSM106972_035730 [Dulcicalothrix desertica PCC 7102]TWH54662.1 uncharacterized protein DUF563 [Dulcicalothrix desertica PCC 7102]
MSLVKQIVFKLFPLKQRNYIRLLMFRVIRLLGIRKILSYFNLSISNKYIHLNHSNVDEILLKYKTDINNYKFVESDEIKPVVNYIGQLQSTIQPYIATTETVLLEINNSCNCFSFRNSHLLDKELNVLGETRTKEFDARLPLPIITKFIDKTICLDGTIAYLSDPDPANYYHWMCRTLPLLRFYQNLSTLAKIDYFYTGKFSISEFHKETLQAAGVCLDKVIQEGCTAKHLLIAVTNRSLHLNNQVNDPINKESFEFTRNLFYKPSNLRYTKKSRIYVSRGNVSRRKIINEAEVIYLIEKYGFETVTMDNRTVQEQANLFSKAEAIIALHGAALTNLLFVQPGSKVIELLPDNYTNNCFYTLASYAEADYFYLQGESLKQNNQDLRLLDTYINIKKLETILKSACLDIPIFERL